MARTRLVSGLLAAALVACTLAACKGQQGTAQNYDDAGKPAYGGVFVSATIGEASNLVPWLAGDAASADISGNIYNALLDYDKNLELEPELAQSYTITNHGLDITFHLKHNVTWADGVPFTSADVMATFKAITNPKTLTPYADKYLMVKSAKAPDPYTFVVHYAHPFGPALASWAQLSIMPRHILDKTPDVNKTTLKDRPVGTGPYTLAKWAHGKEIVLAANHAYFKHRPYIEYQRVRTIPDEDTQFLELRAGRIDSMGLTPLQYDRLTNGKNFTDRYAKYRTLSHTYVYMGFNLKNPLFADRNIRQALSYAINRHDIIQGALMGQGVPAHSPFMPGTWADDPHIAPYPYNPQKAEALLRKAGWVKGADGLLRKNGKPFTFTLVTNQGNAQRIKSAEIIQQDLKRVGITMKIRVQEWATFVQNTINARDFEAVLLGWTMPPEPDPYSIFDSTQTGPQQFNFVSYKNPAADRLIAQSRNTFDQSVRQKALWQFQQVLHADQPYLFLYVPYSLTAIHKRFKGIDPAPAGIGYNFIDWYVPEGQRVYPNYSLTR